MMTNKLLRAYLFVVLFALSACSRYDRFDKNSYQALYSTVVASNNCLNDYLREYLPLVVSGAAVIECNETDRDLTEIPEWISGYIPDDLDYNSLMRFDLVSTLSKLNQDTSLTTIQKNTIAVGLAVMRYYQIFIQEVNQYDGLFNESINDATTKVSNLTTYDLFFEKLYMVSDNCFTKAGSIINDSIPQVGDDIDTCAVEVTDTLEMQERLRRCLELCKDDYQDDMTLAIAGALTVSLLELVAAIAASPSAAAALAAVLWGGEGTFLGVSLNVVSIRNHYASCQENCNLLYT